MRILKFGGTSLANGECIDRAARLVCETSRDTQVVVVASAAAGVTSRLLALVDSAADPAADWAAEVNAIGLEHLEVLERLPAQYRPPAEYDIRRVIKNLRSDLGDLAGNSRNRSEVVDRVLAAGERLSIQLVAATLSSIGCPARPVDGTELVATDSTFGEARVDLEASRRRCAGFLDGLARTTPVVTGFLGADALARTTTLGRGGSDLSAAVLGAVLEAERVEIWTDVDGVLTAPPRLVASVSTIPWLSYEEASELSFFGAKVLHPKTVQPLAERGIPIHVRNTLAPTRRGTEITARSEAASRVVAVSVFEKVTVYRVPSESPVSAKDVLMSCRASADGATLVAVSSDSDATVVGSVGPLYHAGIVTLVGHDIALQPWVAGRALEALARRGIVVRSFAAGAGSHTVALLLERDDLKSAVCIIHDALMLDREPILVRKARPSAGNKEVQHVSAA